MYFGRLKLAFPVCAVVLIAWLLPAVKLQAAPLDDFYEQGRLQGILDYNSYLDSADIEVSVKERTVTLKGRVSSAAEKIYADKLIRKLSTADKFINLVRVDPSIVPRSRSDLEIFVGDTAIESKVNTVLYALKRFNRSFIVPNSQRGVLYLTGEVPDAGTKDAAAQIAGLVGGVKSVVNQIKIADVDEIEERLEDHPYLPPEKITDAWIATQARYLLEYISGCYSHDAYITSQEGELIVRGKIPGPIREKLINDLFPDIHGVSSVRY